MGDKEFPCEDMFDLFYSSHQYLGFINSLNSDRVIRISKSISFSIIVFKTIESSISVDVFADNIIFASSDNRKSFK
jgi:hypothetical protein